MGSKPRERISTSYAEHVTTSTFRGNLAKYLKHAKSGRPVVIKERGRSAFVLVNLEEQTPPSVFGCMRERTDYAEGAIVNAKEPWMPGLTP